MQNTPMPIDISRVGSELESKFKEEFLPNSARVGEEQAKAELGIGEPMNRRQRRDSNKQSKRVKGMLKQHNLLQKKFSSRLRAKITSDNQFKHTQKHNKAWDEINQCSAMVFTLLSVSVTLSPILSKAVLTPYYPDAGYISRVTMALVTELVMLIGQYNQVRARHQDKIGRAATIEDQLLSYQLYNDYMIIAEKYNSSAAYLFDTVSEQIHAAITAYRHEVGDEEGRKLADELRERATAAIAAVHHARKKVDNQQELPAQETEATQQEAEPAIA